MPSADWPGRLATIIGALVAIFACASPPEGPSERAQARDAGAGGARDASADAAPPLPCRPGTFDVCLDAPAKGFLLRSEGAEVAPGDDLEWCEVVTLPGGPDTTHFVGAVEAVMSQYTHHLHVRAIVPASEADRMSRVGHQGPCSENGRVPFGAGFRELHAQEWLRSSFTYPEGVALPLVGGQKILFVHHYVNTSAAPVRGSAVLSVSLLDEADVRRRVGRFVMHRTGFSVSPQSTGSFVTECSIPGDIQLLGLTRHTHGLGTEFVAWHTSPGSERQLLRGFDPREHITWTLREPAPVARGEGLRFRCDFVNPSATTVAYGTRSSDEMCALHVDYVPAGDAATVSVPDCVADDPAESVTVRGEPCTSCPVGQ